MKLNQKIIDSSYKLMEMITKDYHWYTDTPEQPFEHTEGSIWLINPDTKEWMLVLEKPGDLQCYYKTYDTFSKYLNMEKSDFKSFIEIWVEDVLKRGVVSTTPFTTQPHPLVEDVLKRGVNSTDEDGNSNRDEVEDVLENR